MKIVKWFFALLVVLVIVAGVVAWTMPADVAYRYLATRLGPVSLIGVRGTVWEGHADGVSVFGRDLGELDWQIRKAPLIMRSVHADLRIRGADIVTSGLIERDFDGSVRAHDVRFRVPATLFSAALDVPALKLLGTVTGTFDEATLAEGLLTDASGSARWSDAGVSGTAEARFSDILAEFTSKPDGSIGGTVADDGAGNLEINGSFNIAASGYHAEAFLSSRNDDAQVQEALRYIGEAQADGSSHLLITGKLFRLF
jgi:hypothetical protein